MRSGWSQRRAWTVWIFASLAGWIAAIALLAFWFTQGDTLTADDRDRTAPANLAPASGPDGRTEPK